MVYDAKSAIPVRLEQPEPCAVGESPSTKLASHCKGGNNALAQSRSIVTVVGALLATVPAVSKRVGAASAPLAVVRALWCCIMDPKLSASKCTCKSSQNVGSQSSKGGSGQHQRVLQMVMYFTLLPTSMPPSLQGLGVRDGWQGKPTSK
eukprot:2640125-Amphidinium_carterae.1